MKSRQQKEKWIRVNSTAAQAIRYHAATRELDVRFLDGDEYRYEDVPRSKFRALLEADSIGSFVNSEIKPHHSFDKISSRRNLQ